MSEQSDVSQGGPNPVMDNFNRMPASDTAPTSEYAPRNRFLTKDKSVHQLLGGGRGMFNIFKGFIIHFHLVIQSSRFGRNLGVPGIFIWFGVCRDIGLSHEASNFSM